MPSIARLALGLLGAGHAALGVQVKQLWQFPNATQWIESIALRPNGHLLLNTFDGGKMYTLDPSAENAVALVAVQVPGTTALTCLAEIAPDVFALSGGVMLPDHSFQPGTAKIVVVDFSGGGAEPTVRTAAEIPDSKMLNGVAALPSRPHVVFSTDAALGRIYRTDTKTGKVDVVSEDAQLRGSAGVPFGANGIKVHGSYLYITNTADVFFARFAIDAAGNVVGKLEILARFPSGAPDDFWIARDGTAFATTHPDTVYEIGRNDTVSVVATGAELVEPTSAILSRDERTLYVSTGGTGGPGGGAGGKGGQVLAIRL